jgi:hypothetical protein
VSLVKKLEMLNAGLKIEISPEQAAKLTEALQGLEDAETMSNEQAEQVVEACTSVLNEEQKAVLASIDLPRRRGQQAAGGGQAIPMAPAGGPMAPAGGGGRGGGPGGGQGASEPPKNPFKGEEEAKTIESLRASLAK